MTILITRPLAAAKRTAQAFQLTGFETCIDPVLTIIPLPAQIDPREHDAIITTSTNGVESFAALTQHHDMPIFCTGATSAAIARELGFKSVFHPTAPGAKELIPLIKQSPFKRFAYIRGEVVKIDIAQALRDIPDIRTDTYITYKTLPTTGWTDKTIALFHAKKITAITFYSEHSARVTLDLLRKHNVSDYTPSVTALCLSETIAGVLKDFVWQAIKTEPSGKF